jgi:hypothetical protein
MTSNPKASDSSRSRDASSSSPLERRTTSSTFSSSLTKKFSAGSSETGESSTAASKRNSLIISGLNETSIDEAAEKTGALTVVRQVKDARGSHRSHRSRNSGGFLLSTFDSPVENATTTATPMEDLLRQRESSHDSKGKAVLQSSERKHVKRKSNVGTSPLAENVTTAGTGNVTTGNHGVGEEPTADRIDTTKQAAGPKATSTGLDVDSAQIVNLALNLSESRRNASRRILSQPLPPVPGGMGESFAGGSLRQHLQQQRRASRNISPKPNKGERAVTASPRIASGQRVSSPLQAAFDFPDGSYQYHFSASTLARAEKAKNAIELMAQYRRLLQFVPPLKPQHLEYARTASSAGSAPGSPTSSKLTHSRSVSASAPSVRQLGRPYNPLQYIRNRKVRSRNSRAIDGEAQGFGDLTKVTSWVDDVAKEAASENYQEADCLMLPTFSQAAEQAASPHTSPHSGLKNQPTPVKIKRPRIDWYINPADMLADVFWLEQDDNKKLIEDRSGRPIFQQSTDLKRPISRRGDEPEPKPSPDAVKKEPELDLRIDTKLPEFKSLRSDHSDSATSRARQKLREVRDATRIHGHNGLIREHRYLRSRSRSDSDSSDSDAVRAPRRRRSATTDSHDHRTDILEKQMLEMLAKEANETERISSPPGGKIMDTIEKPTLREELERARNPSGGHSRSASLVTKENQPKRDSFKSSSGRASLEVPGAIPRRSLEGLDSTAPNSPQSNGARIANAFVPSIAMDLSSPTRSQHTSPTRRPLSRARSKIRPLFERAPEVLRHRSVDDDSPIAVTIGSKEQTPERSMSPPKKAISKKTEDSVKSVKRAGSSVRRSKGEESGIRGLFKRNPVTRVSDFLWKKEAPAAIGTSSGFSTDESDIDDARAKGSKKGSRDSSAGDQLDEFDALQLKLPNRPELPVFTSPFERRGRSSRTKSDEIASVADAVAERQRAREQRRNYLLEPPPRIDVQNASPTSSPDTGPSNRFNRDDSVSDIESRRGSFSNGVQSADARLNAILGLPGKRRNALPVTGLSALEPSLDTRPSLEGNRTWSISDREISTNRGPMTKREIARVRALFLSSGIKAAEISRRAAEPKDLRTDNESTYQDVAELAKEKITLVPKSQEHRLAARILSDDIQLSAQMWHSSADTFCNSTVSSLVERISILQSRLVSNLTPMARDAADEADEVGRDLVTSQTLKVKRVMDKMDKMIRRRRRRFRWLRRGGWVLVEWLLVGVMWYVWFMVVLTRVVMGVGKGVVRSFRWLFWLD